MRPPAGQAPRDPGDSSIFGRMDLNLPPVFNPRAPIRHMSCEAGGAAHRQPPALHNRRAAMLNKPAPSHDRRAASPRGNDDYVPASVTLTPQLSARSWTSQGSGGAPSGGRQRRGSGSPDVSEVDYHAGMLRKLKVGKGWKQRYVTVSTGQSVLEYRKSKGDAKPKGAIELKGSTVVPDVPEKMLVGKKFEKEAPRDTRLCFRVIPQGDAEYIFAAVTVEERDRWVRLLQAKARGDTRMGPVVRQASAGSLNRTPSLGRQTRRSDGLPRTAGSGLSQTPLLEDESELRPASFRDRYLRGANRRLQIYGSLVCFRVQRVLIEWLRSDSEHTIKPSPALQAIRAFGIQEAEMVRGRSASTEALAAATHGLRHHSQIEEEQRQREAALETQQAALETTLVDDIALQAVQSEIARLRSPMAAGTPSQQSQEEEQRPAGEGVQYFAGWLEVKGQGVSAPWGPRVIGRKGWRLQWCVLAGGFLMAFEKPENQLSATARGDLTFFLLGYDLVTPDSAAADSSSAELIDAQTLQHRPECMLLIDGSEPDPAERKQFLVNVPPRDDAAAANAAIDSRLRMPVGDTKTAADWASAIRTSIATATRHASLSYEFSKARALSQVLMDNTSLLSAQVDSRTDLTSPLLAKQLGVKPENCWVALLCAATFSRAMQEMDGAAAREVLRAMDAWFTPPRGSAAAQQSGGAGRPRSGSGSGGSSTSLQGGGSSGSLSTGGFASSSGSGSFSGISSAASSPHGLPVELAGTLGSSRRKLLRCGLLRCIKEGGGSSAGLLLRATSTHSVYTTFLFSDILLVATPYEPGSGQLGQLLSYHWHCPLTECDIGRASEPHRFNVRHSGSEWTFEVADGATDEALRVGAEKWLDSCRAAREHARVVHREECRLERYEGAVLFADISGFSNLGDELERRQQQAMIQAARSQQQGGDGGIGGGPRRLAAEELANITDEEIEKMVEVVTKAGGDVIQFAGDCVIAVFPAADYADDDLLYETGAPSALSLATAQASKVALQMVQSKDSFFKMQYEKLDAAAASMGYGSYGSSGHGGDASIQELQDALDIHAAVGSGLIYGYHVGGGATDKWHYVVDGPAMEQVRIADGASKAGEVILSNEARALIKPLAERSRIHKRDATTKDDKRVPVWELETFFGADRIVQQDHIWPWEALAHEGDSSELAGLGLRYALADKLRSYIPQPVVDQVDDGQVDHRGWLQSRRVVSTMFVKLFGIDYAHDYGEQAVSELGAMVMLIQRILAPLGATVTRVSCDDKGTGCIVLCDDASSAVTAATQIVADVGMLGNDKYKATIGITTGEVWLGVAGGQTRAEYTMHGSCVNFAARLMSCALIKHTGGVLVDHATMRACAADAAAAAASVGRSSSMPDTAAAAGGDGDGWREDDFEPQEPQKFKGFVDKVVAYIPIPHDRSSSSTARVGSSKNVSSGAAGADAARLSTAAELSQLTYVERQTLQVCAVLAMASAPDGAPMASELIGGRLPPMEMECCMFCADSVAAVHPTLDAFACHAELARLAALGGPNNSRLVALPGLHLEALAASPGAASSASSSMAMYSFRLRSEMESLYHALTIDRLQLLHEHAIEDYERRLHDGTAYTIVGLSYAHAHAQSDKRCVAASRARPRVLFLARLLAHALACLVVLCLLAFGAHPRWLTLAPRPQVDAQRVPAAAQARGRRRVRRARSRVRGSAALVRAHRGSRVIRSSDLKLQTCPCQTLHGQTPRAAAMRCR